MGSSVQNSDCTNQDEFLLVLTVLVLAVNCEGDPEADPALLYLGYPYGLASHPYTLGYGCHNVAGFPVPCAGKKKRAADPEAEAALLYAGYHYAPYYYGHGCHNYLGQPVPCGK